MADDGIEEIREKIKEQLVEEATPSTPSEPIDLDADRFEAFVAGHDRVAIDVWAAWCGPCRQLSPILADLAAEVDDLAVGKVDADEEPSIVRAYGVQGLPTILVFSEGELVDRVVGLQPKAALRQRLAP